MTPSRYRSLVLLTFLLCWSSALLDLVLPGLLPPDLRSALSSGSTSAAGQSPPLLVVLAWTSTLAMTVAMVGLWRFKPWAPRFAAIATGLMVLTVVQVDGVVLSGAAFAIHGLSWLTWGAALLIPRLSPYSAWFAGTAARSVVAA